MLPLFTFSPLGAPSLAQDSQFWILWKDQGYSLAEERAEFNTTYNTEYCTLNTEPCPIKMRRRSTQRLARHSDQRVDRHVLLQRAKRLGAKEPVPAACHIRKLANMIVVHAPYSPLMWHYSVHIWIPSCYWRPHLKRHYLLHFLWIVFAPRTDWTIMCSLLQFRTQGFDSKLYIDVHVYFSISRGVKKRLSTNRHTTLS